MDRPATVAASLNDPAKGPGTGGRITRRALFSLAGTLAFIGILIYLLDRHGSEISRVAERASSATLIAVILLAAASLVARGEDAVAALTAMGNRPSRVDIHVASSAAFVVATLNHYLASPVRAAVLKRLDSGRAPTIPQMFMVDASTSLIEGLLAAGLIAASASALKLGWWIPLLAILAALGGVAVALTIRRRLERLAVFRGLEMLAHSRQRLVVLMLSVIVFTCQIGRTLIVLRATGLHPSLLQAAATFVAGGVLSSLLAGPAAGAAGAPLIIFGHRSLAAAAAAGLILSITALLAALLYAAACGPIMAWRLRHIAHPSERGAETPPTVPTEIEQRSR